MKKKSIVLSLFLGVLYFTLSSDVDGPAHHGHGNVTGAATGTTGHCQTSSCHGGNNPLNIVALQVLDSTTLAPITTYNAAQTYLISITGDATGISGSLPGFGFQASAVLGDLTQAGTFTIPASLASDIHTYPCGATTVVEHSVMLSPITAGINKYSIQFYWTAPSTFSDSVTFYSLLNAVNGDGGDGGDNPNAAPTVTIHESPADKVTEMVIAINDFKVYPNPTSGNPTISYSLASAENVSIEIYDITGRKVEQVTDNELQQAGKHQYQPVITTPGLYFIHLVSGQISSTLHFIKN